MTALDKGIAGSCYYCETLLSHTPIATPQGEYDWVVHRILMHHDLVFARYYLTDDWMWKEKTTAIKQEDPNRENVTIAAACMILER